MSDRARPSRFPGLARPGLAVLLIAMVVVVVLVRPDGDDESTAPGTAATSEAPGPVMPTATPSTPPSEEEFCANFWAMLAAQGEYAAAPDQRGYELLKEAADRLLATGIPRSMSTLALGGLHADLSEAYLDLGLALSPDAIPGAVEASELEGSYEAFGDYLTDYCPG